MRRDERDRVPTGEDEGGRQQRLHQPREVHHLRHVGQVVQPETDRFGLELAELTGQLVLAEELEIDETDLVAARPGRRCDALHPQRLKPEKDLRVHQGTGMDQQRAHRFPSAICRDAILSL
jgi:hypothetical protein